MRTARQRRLPAVSSDRESPSDPRRVTSPGSKWGWIVFSVAFGAALVAGVSSVRGSLSAEEAAWRLAAESLIRDGDLVFDFQDESRMRMSGWPEEVHPSMLIDASGVVRFEGPVLYPVLLSPLIATFGDLGVLILNSLLLLLAVAAAVASLEWRCGGGSIWTVTACLFGSVLFAYLQTSLPVLLLVAATSVALTLISKRFASSADGLPEMYEDAKQIRRPTVRFLAAGGLLGVVAAHHPVYLLLLAVPLVLTHGKRRLRATLLVLVGALAVLGSVWLLSGLWQESGLLPTSQQRVEVSVGEGLTGVERSRMTEGDFSFRLSEGTGALLLWNAVYSIVGRHVGLLPYFLPLAMLLALWRPTTGRTGLAVLAAAGLVVTLVLLPFDFALVPEALGNRMFVPFFVILWWLPARSFGRIGSLATLMLATTVLWPLWLPGGGILADVGSGRFPRGAVLDLLPPETTQRDLPMRGEVVTRDLLVRPGAGLQPAGRRGHFVLAKGRSGELVIASPASVRELQVVFDAAAATSLEVDGGTVGSMTLTPDGGVAFDVLLGKSRVRHPVWWSREVHSFHRLRLSMPTAKGTTVFSIGSGG
jgi:hypothetical protein